MFSRLIPRPCRYLLLGICLPGVVAAEPCPPDTYAVCLNATCLCMPEFSNDPVVFATQAIAALAQARAPALAAWLSASRDDAFLTSAPVPAAIRQQLAGYISEEVLERARFKTGDSSSLNLSNLVMTYGGFERDETVIAITLVDVVVFRDEADAGSNIALWAHELTHVQQFLDWGVSDFAQRYVDDAASVEAAASAVQDAYAKAQHQ